MAWQLLSADNDAGRTLAFLDDFDSFTITPRLNGYAEVALTMATLDKASQGVAVGRTSIKAYQDGALRFNGKVWEPLERGPRDTSIVARDPLAEFLWRRVQADKDYTATNNAGGPWDAGLIAYDRLAIQNARRNTYLRAGTRQASINRLRGYTAGQRENEIFGELASAASGFFYRAVPLDGVANFMADLNIYYPNAGNSREEVRFEYGENTIDNLVDFKQTEMLPLNGMTVSGASDTGGRLAQRAEDAASIASYGLFEDETGYTDVSDTTLLAQQAQARINPNPPLTLALTPGIDSPKLFTDFMVGDFVRVRILWGGIDLFTWARALEATLEVNKEGVESLSSITVEVVTGDQINTPPEILWRTQQDDDRRRLEALERRVQNLSVSTAASPGAPAPGAGTGDPTPVDPTPPAPPPPPAPSQPPSISGLGAFGAWYLGESPKGVFHADIDGHGQATTVYFEVVGRGNTGSQNVGTGGGTDAEFGGLAKNTAYTVIVHASNAAGETTASTGFTTPNIQFA